MKFDRSLGKRFKLIIVFMKLCRNLVEYVQRFGMQRLEIDLVTRGTQEIEDGYYDTSEGPQDKEYQDSMARHFGEQ